MLEFKNLWGENEDLSFLNGNLFNNIETKGGFDSSVELPDISCINNIEKQQYYLVTAVLAGFPYSFFKRIQQDISQVESITKGEVEIKKIIEYLGCFYDEASVLRSLISELEPDQNNLLERYMKDILKAERVTKGNLDAKNIINYLINFYNIQKGLKNMPDILMIKSEITQHYIEYLGRLEANSLSVFLEPRRNKGLDIPELIWQVLEKTLKNYPELIYLFNCTKDVSDVLSHQFFVASVSAHIGVIMDCEENEIKTLVTAALLHDIGKLTVKELVVLPRRFTDSEYNQVKLHALCAYDLIKIITNDNLLAAVAGWHHLGYGNPTQYDDFDTKDKLLAHKLASIEYVGDIFAALRGGEDRPYIKKQKTLAEIKEILIKSCCSPGGFDSLKAQALYNLGKFLKHDWGAANKITV